MIQKLKTVRKLRNGERMSADEFRERYAAMPPGIKAELLDGEVFMPSPVSAEGHGKPHSGLNWFLTHYTVFTPGTATADNSTIRLSDRSEPQPDMLVHIDPECGGQVEIDADGYIVGAPELVGEVSASSADIDTTRKLDVYRRSGVREYIIHRTEDEALDWFVLRRGRFVPLAPDKADGLLKSRTFPGLWLDAPALVRRDLMSVLTALTRGVQSPEHAKFVKKLAARPTACRLPPPRLACSHLPVPLPPSSVRPLPCAPACGACSRPWRSSPPPPAPT